MASQPANGRLRTMLRQPWVAAIAVVWIVTGSLPRAQSRSAAAPVPAAPAVCDRACLAGIADAYVTALVAHDPLQAPLAKSVKFTENTGRLEVGEGLWIGASEAPSAFAIHVADPATRQVALLATMKEFDKPVLLALRLRVDKQQITEVEHIVVRSLTAPGLSNLETPRPGLLVDVDPKERVPRAQMLTIANSYYDSILQGRGSVAPYASDCERHENGMAASGSRDMSASAPGRSMAAAGANAIARIRALTCSAAIDTGYLSYITGIDLRRVTIVDEQKGLVFGLAMFRAKGELRSIRILNVPGVDTVPVEFGPLDLQAAHVFKITDGKIHEIESVGYTLPYKSDSGW
jgi:hypothetical protein